MQNEITQLEAQFQKDLDAADSQEAFEALKIKYLGRKSELAGLFSKVPGLPADQRGQSGKALNELKNRIHAQLEGKAKTSQATEKKLDLTFPASPFDAGSRHVLSSVLREICAIFEKLGFIVIEGTEIEDEWHNFSALNIPLDHPSRDAFDTFYVDLAEKDTGKWLLRSHTSPSQIRVMRAHKPPLAVISPGRVYRPDQVDASHSFMFHQVEGFAVDTHIKFSHLKGILLHFFKEYFSSDSRLRFRPSFFPFTEPSAEVDISCFVCKGQKTKCSVCKGTGWIEILGCGMTHPKVLAACDIDTKKYKGFAFGMGVERIAMLKYAIDDIRLFYENDVKFLEQF